MPLEIKRDYSIWLHPNRNLKMIKCHKCEFQTRNEKDILLKYCPICKKFHSEEEK